MEAFEGGIGGCNWLLQHRSWIVSSRSTEAEDRILSLGGRTARETLLPPAPINDLVRRGNYWSEGGCSSLAC